MKKEKEKTKKNYMQKNKDKQYSTLLIRNESQNTRE